MSVCDSIIPPFILASSKRVSMRAMPSIRAAFLLDYGGELLCLPKCGGHSGLPVDVLTFGEERAAAD